MKSIMSQLRNLQYDSEFMSKLSFISPNLLMIVVVFQLNTNMPMGIIYFFAIVAWMASVHFEIEIALDFQTRNHSNLKYVISIAILSTITWMIVAIFGIPLNFGANPHRTIVEIIWILGILITLYHIALHSRLKYRHVEDFTG